MRCYEVAFFIRYITRNKNILKKHKHGNILRVVLLTHMNVISKCPILQGAFNWVRV